MLVAIFVSVFLVYRSISTDRPPLGKVSVAVDFRFVPPRFVGENVYVYTPGIGRTCLDGLGFTNLREWTTIYDRSGYGYSHAQTALAYSVGDELCLIVSSITPSIDSAFDYSIRVPSPVYGESQAIVAYCLEGIGFICTITQPS